MRKPRAFPWQKSPKEFAVFKKLNSPAKVQDFVNRLGVNFESKHSTLRSPLMVLKYGKAHCVEGALFAAAALWYHGRPPLIIDLMTTEKDHGHVVALFKERGLWGGISKTNHAVLRYRDPVYKSPRELVMSYFNEYFLDSGIKTLRSYSEPFDMRTLGDGWLTERKNLWSVNDALDAVPHTDILKNGGHRQLRPADALEIKAGKLTERKRRK